MPFARTPSGRRYGTSQVSPGPTDGLAPTPHDPRPHWPESQREFTDTTLPDGTVLRDWQDPPLEEDAPKVPLEVTNELDVENEPFARRTNMTPAKRPAPDRWAGPLGPLPRHR